MPVERLDHVQLAMPPGEEDRAVAFYSGVLGLDHVPKPEPLAARGGCWFETGSAKVHLGVEEGFRPSQKAHPALVVTGLDELVDRFREAGVDVTDGESFDGARRVYVHDPFGNRIELFEPR